LFFAVAAELNLAMDFVAFDIVGVLVRNGIMVIIVLSVCAVISL
jgi:hypothetical protein